MELTTSWKEEGIKEGKAIGEKQGLEKGLKQASLTIALRLLDRRLGSLSLRMQKRIEKLSLTQLEELSEALLDFSKTEDLTDWLNQVAAKGN